MERLAYTYALVKSLCDLGDDYVDCFWPFIIKVLPKDGRFVDADFIQRSVEDDFGLHIFSGPLRTILSRAKKKGGYVERKEKEYGLTQAGQRYLDSFETDRDVERLLNSLFEDIKQSLSDSGISTSSDQIQDTLVALVHRNTESLVEFFIPGELPSQSAVPLATGLEKSLVEYILTADQRKPEHFKILQHLVFGAVISAILGSEQHSEIIEIRERKFKHFRTFLDSNFTFFVLGLHTAEFNDPAQELFGRLKQEGFETKVFSFTVDEMCGVINGYIREGYRYPTSMNVDTLYSSLSGRGWTQTQAKEFITNIEDILASSGIRIEWVRDVDLRNYNPADDQLLSLMGRYKPGQAIFSRNHDLAVIETIRALRGRPVRNIEQSGVLFLTSDKGLYRFNLLEMGHRENGTICEVILDGLLANILWLKDPRANIPLKSIIGVHSRELFVKRRVWERFYENLRELKREGKIIDSAISMLFYHNYIETVLREFDETEVDEITPEFTLHEIEKASKLPEEDMQRIAEEFGEREKELVQRLKEEVSAKEQEESEKWLERIEGIKKDIRENAAKLARRRSSIYASLLTALSLGLMCGMYFGFKEAGVPSIAPWLVPLLIGGGGIGGIWSKLRSYFERNLADSTYISRLKDAGLDRV